MRSDSAPRRAVALIVLMCVSLSALAEAQDTRRVAHLTYSQGSISLQSGGRGDWSLVTPNATLAPLDNLWVDRGSRAELYWQSTAIRLDAETSITLQGFAENHADVKLWLGSLMVHISRFDRAQFGIETPNSKFSLNESGDYRISVNGPGDETLVTVWSGNAKAKGTSAEYEIHADETVRLIGTNQLDIQSTLASDPDDFEKWAFGRDQNESPVVSDNPRGGDTDSDPNPDGPDDESKRSGGIAPTNLPPTSAPLNCPTPWCEWDAYPDIWAMVFGDGMVAPDGQFSHPYRNSLTQDYTRAMRPSRAIPRPSQLPRTDLAIANVTTERTTNAVSSTTARENREPRATSSAETNGRPRSDLDQKKCERLRAVSQPAASRPSKP